MPVHTNARSELQQSAEQKMQTFHLLWQMMLSVFHPKQDPRSSMDAGILVQHAAGNIHPATMMHPALAAPGLYTGPPPPPGVVAGVTPGGGPLTTPGVAENMRAPPGLQLPSSSVAVMDARGATAGIPGSHPPATAQKPPSAGQLQPSSSGATGTSTGTSASSLSAAAHSGNKSSGGGGGGGSTSQQRHGSKHAGAAPNSQSMLAANHRMLSSPFAELNPGLNPGADFHGSYANALPVTRAAGNATKSAGGGNTHNPTSKGSSSSSSSGTSSAGAVKATSAPSGSISVAEQRDVYKVHQAQEQFLRLQEHYAHMLASGAAAAEQFPGYGNPHFPGGAPTGVYGSHHQTAAQMQHFLAQHASRSSAAAAAAAAAAGGSHGPGSAAVKSTGSAVGTGSSRKFPAQDYMQDYYAAGVGGGGHWNPGADRQSSAGSASSSSSEHPLKTKSAKQWAELQAGTHVPVGPGTKSPAPRGTAGGEKSQHTAEDHKEAGDGGGVAPYNDEGITPHIAPLSGGEKDTFARAAGDRRPSNRAGLTSEQYAAAVARATAGAAASALNTARIPEGSQDAHGGAAVSTATSSTSSSAKKPSTGNTLSPSGRAVIQPGSSKSMRAEGGEAGSASARSPAPPQGAGDAAAHHRAVLMFCCSERTQRRGGCGRHPLLLPQQHGAAITLLRVRSPSNLRI